LENKITLVINSKNPVPEWLDNLFLSARGFDERVIYIDGVTAREAIQANKIPDDCIVVSDGKSRTIAEGFNHAVAHADGEWIVTFCDDDHFHADNLSTLLAAIRSGSFEYTDIIHFPVILSNGTQWGTAEDFTLEQIKECNLIPHSSFIRKEAFKRLGGYRMDACADWNLWVRAKMAPMRFKGFAKPVYYFRYGHERSAFSKQVQEYGGIGNIHVKVLENV